MLRIKEEKDQLIVSELPLLQWANSIGMAGVFFLIFYLSLNSATKFDVVFFGTMIFGAVSLYAFYNFLNTPFITTKINQVTKRIAVNRRTLLNSNFQIRSFSEIRGLVYVNQIKFNDKFDYQLMLTLTDGSNIKLSTKTSSGKNELLKAARQINNYIGSANANLFQPTFFS